MDRRTFLTGLASVAAAPVLPALSHGVYAGEGIIGVDFEAVRGAVVMSGLYPYQKTVVAFLEAGAHAYGPLNYARAGGCIVRALSASPASAGSGPSRSRT
jgi:hypothetical protein